MKATLTTLLLTLGITLVNSAASAQEQRVVTTKRYILKSRDGSIVKRIENNQELIAETCSQSYCRIRMRHNGRVLKFLLKRLELRQPITSSNRLSMRSRHTHRNALDPDVDTSRSDRRTGVNFIAPTCSCANGTCRVSSGFGPRRAPRSGASTYHQGLDIAGGAGTPIVAAESGTIVLARSLRGYGNTVDINHGLGYKTRYAHMSRFVRRSGWVQRGEIIGYMGATGTATGPNLHFEVFRNGARTDPSSVVGVSRRSISRRCENLSRNGSSNNAGAID